MMAEMVRNPEMRRMLFNPDMIRMQLQMQRAMGGGGAGGGGQRMAAPGVTDNTPSSTVTGDGSTATPNQPNTTGPTQQQEPLATLLGGAGANPFGNLFGQAGVAGQPQNQNNTSNAGSDANAGTTSPTPNPFAGLFPAAGGQQQANPIADMTARLMQNPEAMQAAMNMFGQMGGGGGALGAPPNPLTGNTGTAGTTNSAPNPFASLFAPGAMGAGGFGTPPPQDNRPPEELYETQLRQLNEMGFYDFDRNVSALRRSGGNVQGAIEFLFG
jgi:ubiquilin